jgi:hypothetical protein
LFTSNMNFEKAISWVLFKKIPEISRCTKSVFLFPKLCYILP